MVQRASRSLALFLTLAIAAAPLPGFAQPAPTAGEIAEGDKAARAQDWSAALAHYQAAQQASPGWRAQMGIADALYQLGRLGEAWQTYDDVQKTYGPKLGPVEKGLVATRLKELAKKTGSLSIRVNEAGAEVTLDGQSLGASPPPALFRVPVGGHDVKVTKAGFAPFAAHADVSAEGTTTVEVALVAQATQGHVTVHVAGNPAESLRVLVDGVDVGATPWEGDLPAGTHQISGRSSTSAAAAQTVDVAAGSRVAVDLVSSDTAAHLQVRTNDGKGSIFVDGAARGEGAFAADVAPGPHTIVVTREGFERFEKTMPLLERQTWAEMVTLKPIAATGSAAADTAERAFEGMYGGFGLMAGVGVGGQGSELDTNCSTLGASKCDTPSPTGAGAFGYVGWTWNPVGFELFLMGLADQNKETAHFTGTGGALPASAPNRDEVFTFVRAGGGAAVRARASFQTRIVRGTVAGGVGFAYRQMFMKREATATDNSGRSQTYVPDSVGYLSPAVSVEGAVQFRVSPTIGIALGLQMWADNASIAGSNAAPAASGKFLVNASDSSQLPAAIPTPGYHMASGPQVFLMPFLGLQFGP